MAKETTGGSGVSSAKREVKCSTVPSPPNDTQKSTSAAHGQDFFGYQVWREQYFRVDHEGPKIYSPVLKVDQIHPSFIIWARV